MSLLKKYWLAIIAILFALAVIFGLIQKDPYSGDYPNESTPGEVQDKSLQAYYEQSNQIKKDSGAAAPAKASFFAAGDIMLSRQVAESIQKARNPDLPFSKMSEILADTDFNFANLESPISGSPHFNKSGSLIFNAPEEYAAALKKYNFRILTLANNHALDQGQAGLAHTRDYLDNLGIQYIGTGSNLDEAWQAKSVEVRGMEICFFGASYASVNDNGKTTNEYVARIEDASRLHALMPDLRRRCDFIVATMHAGTEYTRNPNQSQIDFAHAAIDAGADMVIGHHPHWVQTMEKYQDKYIFYSLGNFVFDQMWSQETKEGLTLKIRISKPEFRNQSLPSGAATLDDLQGPKISATLDSIELVPVIIENYSTPRPATEGEAKKILEKIGLTETILK